MTRLRPLLLLLVALPLLLAACASDGRALRPPAPGQTLPATVPSTTAPVGPGTKDDAVIGTVAPDHMLLTSSAFADGATIPVAFTCDSSPSAPSPPLAWTGIPTGTKELALTVVDPDAGGFVHWTVAGIDPSVRETAQGFAPVGGIQLTNGAGQPGWTPPCPPAGTKAHRYVFTLYALGQASGVTATTPTSDALASFSANAFDTAVLAATYTRAG